MLVLMKQPEVFSIVNAFYSVNMSYAFLVVLMGRWWTRGALRLLQSGMLGVRGHREAAEFTEKINRTLP